MSLIVEDGTGLEDSNSYVSVSESEDILLDLGYDQFPSETDLIKATLYIDTNFRPVSNILNEDQALLWPREKFTDSQDRKITGIPFELKRTTSIVAASFIDNDLFDEEPSITQESYGDTSVTYSGPVSQTDGNVKAAMVRLKKLGYGSSSSTIRLTRA